MNHPPNHLSVLAREQSGAGVYHIPTMAGARVENGKHVSPSAPHAHGMMNFSAAQSVGPPHFHPADVWDGAPPPTSLQARSATTDSSGDWRAAALHPVLTTGSDPEFSTLAPGSSALLHRVPQVVASSAAGTTATPFFASTAVATAREVVVVGDHLPGSRSALPEPAAIPTWTTPSTSGVASASARFGAGALPPAPQPAAVAGRHFLPTRPITTHSVHRSPPAPIAPAMPAPPMAVLDLGISRAGDAFSAAPSARAATAHTNGRGSPAGLSFEDFAPHPAPPEPPSAWNYSPPSYVLPQTHPTDTPDLPGTTVGQGVGPVVASVIGSAHQMPRVSHVTLAPPAPPSLPARGPADSNSYWEAGFGTHVAAPAGDVAPSQLWDTARHGAQPKGLPEAPAELVLSRAPPQSSSGVQRKPNLIVNYLGAMTSAELQVRHVTELGAFALRPIACALARVQTSRATLSVFCSVFVHMLARLVAGGALRVRTGAV